MLAALNQSAAAVLRKPLLRPLLTPAVFDFWAREVAPGAALERTLARVIERRVEAKDAVTLILQPNAHFRGFAPGQHVNLTVEVDGVRLTRSYSFTGIPRKDGRISFTVKRTPNGKVSSWLCTRTRVGDVLELGAAFGKMTLPDPLPEKLLLLAGGSGITPLMSLIRALAARGMPAHVTLVYWARTRAELCFLLELQALAARHPTFRVAFALEQENSLLPGELRGRPDAGQLNSVVSGLAAHSIYACGPSGFVQALKTICAGAAEFHAEAFTAPATQTTSATGTVRVELTASKRVLEVAAGQPLLAALEAQGVTPAYGCRMGICNTCVCRKSSGATQNINNGIVSTESDDALRICVSTAHSDLTLDL